MLIQQMAAMHLLYMKYAKLLIDPDNLVQAELIEGMVSKTARNFWAQCEALYRSQERPIVGGVTQGTRESTLETRQRSTASQDPNGTRASPVASDGTVDPVKEESAQLRHRVRPVNNGK
jgi:hypothetical protein